MRANWWSIHSLAKSCLSFKPYPSLQMCPPADCWASFAWSSVCLSVCQGTVYPWMIKVSPAGTQGSCNREEKGQGQPATFTSTCLLPLNSKSAFPCWSDSNIQLSFLLSRSKILIAIHMTQRIALISGKVNTSQFCRWFSAPFSLCTGIPIKASNFPWPEDSHFFWNSGLARFPSQQLRTVPDTATRTRQVPTVRNHLPVEGKGVLEQTTWAGRATGMLLRPGTQRWGRHYLQRKQKNVHL